jgi:hypothetical protein
VAVMEEANTLSGPLSSTTFRPTYMFQAARITGS